ncbi:hypothetical protein SARC_02969 [Sphaeroforma arctica JP610]|uniref:DSBA-like thioredoxin domain-containing protein n=1 Tax=Sphaeroforma arctica JP610 TaxID=667725 RepID=A0A0L0G992_9EUKA|nr:hypothetical protein SARC_02969 [Sphaeroforma arctica JP610]KNC84828.1 hypothetical protein SARC_02969 [Sphaeroforma arctica JP610]|eukprot:XP_014158730.1 hypothetical protein SARC_02969 [Sphaeroforma arctica JP610]
MDRFRNKQPAYDFAVTWRPYMLNPTLPKYGVDKVEAYNQKFGESRVKAMVPHLTSVFKKEDIDFSFGGLISNTMDSHRLLNIALGNGDAAGRATQDKVVNLLFKAYFEESKNIGDPELLTQVAAEAGLDVENVKAVLASDTGVDNIMAEMAERNEGVNGVPHFIIQNKYRIGGAEDPQEFVEIFDEIAVSSQ